MKSMKKSIAVLALALASTGAMADWNAGVGYSNISDDSLSLEALTINAGYTLGSLDSNLTVMPQIRFGTGIKNDNGIDIDRYAVVATRFDYQADETLSFFFQPAYRNMKGDDFDTWDFGIGAGSTYLLDSGYRLEIMYEEYDGADVLSFGINYQY